MRASTFVRAGTMLPLALAAGCGDATGLWGGSVRVSLTITGVDVAPGGYIVSLVAGGPRQNIAPNSSVVLRNLEPRDYVTRLGGGHRELLAPGWGQPPRGRRGRTTAARSCSRWRSVPPVGAPGPSATSERIAATAN